MKDDGEDPPAGDRLDRWGAMPQDPSDPRPSPAGDDEEGDGDHEDAPDTELCALVPEAAVALCARLEANGIPCELAPGSRIDPGRARVLVCGADLGAAREVLADPTGAALDEDDLRDDAYYLGHWLCPRCHEPALDRLPASPRLIRYRRVWYATIVLGPVVAFLDWADPIPWMTRGIDAVAQWLVLLWLAAVLVMPATFPSRRRRCRRCGWAELDDG